MNVIDIRLGHRLRKTRQEKTRRLHNEQVLRLMGLDPESRAERRRCEEMEKTMSAMQELCEELAEEDEEDEDEVVVLYPPPPPPQPPPSSSS